MAKKGFIRKYFAPYKGKLAANLLLRIISVIFGVFLFVGIAPFLSILFGNDATVVKPEHFELTSRMLMGYAKYFLGIIGREYGKIWALTIVVAAIGLSYSLKNTSAYWALYSYTKIKNSAIQTIRVDIFTKLLNLPMFFHKKSKKGDILSRITSDVQLIDNQVFSQFDLLANNLISVALFLLILLTISPLFTLFSLLTLPPVMFIISRFSKMLKKKSLLVQQKLGELVSISEESFDGLKVIKSNNAETFWTEKFDITNDEIFKNSNKTFRRTELASPISELFGTIAIMAILCTGSYFVIGGSNFISPELFLTFLLVLALILDPVKQISMSFYNIKKGQVAVSRIEEILSEKCELSPVIPADTKKNNFDNCIEFRNLIFDYCNESEDAIFRKNDALFPPNKREHILDIPYLKFEKNKFYAIIGESGSGKTTLIDLISKFYDNYQGEITIDDIPLKSIVSNDIRKLVAYVSQDIVLFNDTVMNNILWGAKEMKELKKVEEAAKIANAHDFILMLENGYETDIGDMGNKLSGGQRQRISIARAILKNAPIIIFDEAVSALDNESERAIANAINNLKKNHTIIMIAHRLSSVKNADVVVELSNGKIL
ncbi:MAG: ABC transporter ATP-binding protein/permease [Bacteroidales bacterium]|jgi:ABC-type multidrug transport system fused ATPase/permease subunit|nr:ABC transporter ATP-binding protein/permease [Bacteroidales bacterium]